MRQRDYLRDPTWTRRRMRSMLASAWPTVHEVLEVTGVAAATCGQVLREQPGYFGLADRIERPVLRSPWPLERQLRRDARDVAAAARYERTAAERRRRQADQTAARERELALEQQRRDQAARESRDRRLAASRQQRQLEARERTVTVAAERGDSLTLPRTSRSAYAAAVQLAIAVGHMVTVFVIYKLPADYPSRYAVGNECVYLSGVTVADGYMHDCRSLELARAWCVMQGARNWCERSQLVEDDRATHDPIDRHEDPIVVELWSWEISQTLLEPLDDDV